MNIKKNLIEVLKTIICFTRINEFSFDRFPDFNIDKGKKCMVIGNGPSLKSLLNKYENGEFDFSEDCFVVNFFPLNPLFYRIRPKGLFWSDYVFIQDTEGSTEKVRKMYDEMQDKVDWNLTIYLNAPWKEDNKRLIEYSRLTNPRIRFVFLNRNYCDNLCPRIRHKLYKTGYFMPTEGTVVNTAIYVALLRGFKEIELYGSELSMFKDLEVGEDNQLYIVQKHFYEKDYRVKQTTDGGGKAYVHTYMYYMYAMFYSHYLLEDFSKYMGAHISNCTPNSMIDVYDRK
jgi:hypothetical protein